MSFEHAEQVANAVLYEGYILYPYRASAGKNRVRWQFGIVAPRGYSEAVEGDTWFMQTQCLVEPGAAPQMDVRIRFLQIQGRQIEAAVAGEPGRFQRVEHLEVDDQDLVTWEEGVEHQIDLTDIALRDLVAADRLEPLHVADGRDVELVRRATGAVAARIVRVRWPMAGLVRVAAEHVAGLLKVTIRIENLTDWPGGESSREQALRHALVGAHTLAAVRDGAFVSLLDPPAPAVEAARSCMNLHTWPILAGPPGRRDLVLSSPIILYDHAAVAPESPGDFFDATEIDKLLALRVMTMTNEEKREARGTDARARQIVERADALPPDVFDRLHGAIRYLRASAPCSAGDRLDARSPDERRLAGRGVGPAASEAASWEALLNPPGETPPDRTQVQIGHVAVMKGSHVRLRPRRRADAMDMFLSGRTATVAGIYRDVDERTWVAVTVDDDPASDLHGSYGRFFYFDPDEVDPIETEGAPAGVPKT